MYWNIRSKERLIMALMLANTPDLMEKFLNDILTEKEIELLVKRLKVACMIHDGASYKETQEATGLSSTTIAHISKKMINRDGGFQNIIRKFTSGNKKAYFD